MTNFFKTSQVLLFSILFCWTFIGFTQPVVNIGKANQVYNQHQAKQAHELYQQVLQSPTISKQDKVFAAQRLAHIEGHLFKDIVQARRWIQQGLTFNYNEALLYRRLADLESEHQQYVKAKIAAKMALKTAKSAIEPALAKIQLADIVLKEQVKLLKAGKAIEQVHLKEARQIITEAILIQSTRIQPYKIQLGLALLAKDGQTVYNAWRGYFLLSKSEKVSAVLQKAHQLIKKTGESWQNQPLNGEQSQQLFLGLFRSRFFEEAHMVSLLYPIEEPWKNQEVQEALVYLNFVKKTEKAAYDFYEKVVIKPQKSGKLRKRIATIAKELWSKLFWKNKPTKFSMIAIKKALEDKFGARYALGKTNGYPAFYGGHAVQDQTKSVDQYGKTGTIRFISLDAIVSNDYTGWYRKRLRVGGWARKNLFVQLRPAYAKTGITEWSILTDRVAQKKFLDKMNKRLLEDEALARKNPYAYLSGTRDKIMYQEIKRIRQEVVKQHGENKGLQLHFIAYMKRLIQNASIFTHEGRHVIDKNLSESFRPTDLEYRAKLSEIALCPYPKYMLVRQVLGHNIGAKSPHGQANLKVVKNLVQWVEKNQTIIQGFDQQIPTLMQLDLLTNAQLKTAIQSFDPLATKQGRK